MDELVFRALNALLLRSDILDAVIFFVAQQLPLLVFLALLFWAGKDVWNADARAARGKILEKWTFVFAASLAAWIFAELAKEWMQSPRPFLILHDAKLLFPHGDYDSFPSAHTAVLSALATALALSKEKYIWILWACAVLVGAARVAAGIHWPYDIVGGVVLGSVAAYALFRARRHFA